MKVTNVEVYGFNSAFRGMRNPMDSWDRSDSEIDTTPEGQKIDFYLGDADKKLAQKLIIGGGEHRKFMRQIQVWCDINLPRYIWQELDTYKFGTKNSQSTMHKLHSKVFDLDDFYLGEYDNYESIDVNDIMVDILLPLNILREKYLATKDYEYIRIMKRILPESYLQMRTWNTNYEELRNVYFQRKNHRMKEEWKIVIDWIESLPYAKELITHE